MRGEERAPAAKFGAEIIHTVAPVKQISQVSSSRFLGDGARGTLLARCGPRIAESRRNTHEIQRRLAGSHCSGDRPKLGDGSVRLR